MKKRTGTKGIASVSASQLAQMGVCERLVVFEHRYGKRVSPEQRQAIRRGLDEHDRFYREGLDAPTRRGRCYIATFVFGDGRETTILRQFREQVLRPRRLGRWLIKIYYRTAPAICKYLERWPVLQKIVRLMLHPIVRFVTLLLMHTGEDHEC